MKMDVNDQYGVYSEQAEDYKAEEKIEAKDINQEYELSTYDNMEESSRPLIPSENTGLYM